MIKLWGFSRSHSLREAGIFQGMTDWHSHILPGVDDGVQTMEESLAILSLYGQLGMAAVWLTPHVMEDMPNKTGDLRRRFAELQAAYSGPVVLHLSAEHMIDQLFDERLSAGDVLPLGDDGRQLLVETSYFNPPICFHQRLQQVMDSGYTPVLAHPERYVYMELHDYEQLRAMGVRFQLNLVSLTGMYGRLARQKAERLLRLGYYDLAGTDIHSLSAHQQQMDVKVGQEILTLATHAARVAR